MDGWKRGAEQHFPFGPWHWYVHHSGYGSQTGVAFTLRQAKRRAEQAIGQFVAEA